MFELNHIYNTDCMIGMKELPNDYIPLILTDIPYDGVNRDDGGLRKLDKGKADILTFNLQDFLKELYRISNGTIIIFCGVGSVSEISNFFETKKGTVRTLVWEKTNPSPMNGKQVYLSGIELGVWFKKLGKGTYNGNCKNTVLRYPNGSSKNHPTEKNHDLLKDLINTNSKIGGLNI